MTATNEPISWNAANQPVSINGITATYDALGRMVETGSGSSYQQFVFRPSGAMLAVYNAGTGTLVKGTVPLPGGETAIYTSTGLNYIRHTDWLGSSRFSTTWAHAVYAKESYAPFGETYNEAGTADRSFTGQDQDVISGSGGTGVYDFLYRKHDPSAGRWLSPDPAGWSAADLTNPQSLNRYAYVLNSPLNLFDPNGLCIEWSDVNLIYVDPQGNTVVTPSPGVPTIIGGICGPPPTGCSWIFTADGSQWIGMVCEGSVGTDYQHGQIQNGNGGGGGGAPSNAPPNNPCPAGTTPHTQRMLVTGYDNSYQSTGKNPGDPHYGQTTSGAMAGPGTIAAPRTFSFGTQMFIPGYGLGTVLDRGGAIRNSHIDLWFPSTQQAINWGAQHLQVTVCR